MSNETVIAPMAPADDAQHAIPPEVMEKVVIGGGLAELNAAQRAEYYTAVCRSLGLNPITKPFEFLTLMASSGCTRCGTGRTDFAGCMTSASTSPTVSGWVISILSPLAPKIALGVRMRAWGTCP